MSYAQLQDKFMLRLPDGMRDQLKADALANERSMNAEIIARLSGDQPTLRDRFAGQALPTILAAAIDGKRKIHGWSDGLGQVQAIASDAYTVADAMIAEREKGRAL